MLSEKSYWIILIVGLIVFVSLIAFVLIPYEILDYNLGINLISESTGIIVTIVFLTWLFSLRERLRWKVVKHEVYLHIQNNLSLLFDNVLTYVENGYEFKNSLLNIKDEDTKKKQVYMQLFKLKDAEKITLDTKLLSIFLEDRTFLEYFAEVARRFSNIESKYSRFLSPQLTISLMRIQDDLRVLEHAFEMNKLFKIAPEKSSKKWLTKVNSTISDMVSVSFKLLIEEIYKIHEMGIEIPYALPLA